MLPSIETSHLELLLSVRDYELDSFGVINKAVYQNYLEHTHYQFLESQGLKLTAYIEQGLSPVITKAEIEYPSSLLSRDDFVVSLGLALLSKVKFIFLQEIQSLPNKTLILSARITGTILNSSGRPFFLAAFQNLRTLLTSKTKNWCNGGSVISEKQRSAEAACEYVKDGMIVGLGTGSTAEFAVCLLYTSDAADE